MQSINTPRRVCHVYATYIYIVVFFSSLPPPIISPPLYLQRERWKDYAAYAN